MQRKKGESAPRPAIFHTEVYNPNPKQQASEPHGTHLPYARTENRLFKVPRPHKRDKKP